MNITQTNFNKGHVNSIQEVKKTELVDGAKYLCYSTTGEPEVMEFRSSFDGTGKFYSPATTWHTSAIQMIFNLPIQRIE